MNAPYRPPPSTVTAEIRTAAGHVHDTFHIPKGQSFIDHLAKFAFWSLTNVILPGSSEPVPFFSVRSAAALVVIPEADEAALHLAPLHGPAEKHRVSCLLARFARVNGEIELLPGVRVSDYVIQHTGFLCLRDAELADEAKKLPVVMVNAAALVGVSEPDQSSTAR